MKKEPHKDANLVTYTEEQVRNLKDHTDYQRLDNMTDDDIDYSDIPTMDEKTWANAKVAYPEVRK